MSLNGGHVYPYTSWSMAATNIQAAIDAASAEDTVLVSNGVYASGGAFAAGRTNRVAITKTVTVRSMNGPTRRSSKEGRAVFSFSVRCAYLVDGAQLDGFTLTHGDAER